MKKLISVLLVIVALTALVFPVSANDTYTEIEYHEDGTYTVTEIEEATNGIGLFAISTKSGSKTATTYSASGATLFSITVHGTFNYNGTVARSTSSSYSKAIYDTTWSFVSGSSSYTANNATATGRFTNSGNTKSVSVTLYCDQDGNLY